MTTKIIYWDWKEYAPTDLIAKAVAEVSNGHVHIHDVNTNSDQFAIVVTDEELTEEQVASVWKARWSEEL